MKRTFLSTLFGAALATVAAGAQAITNFEQDVNDAIDDGLQFARDQNYFTVYTQGNGMSLLTLLQKETIPAGYAGLTVPGDQTLAQNAACILISDGNFGGRGGFYSYYDGQVLMGLSVYLSTGGPDTPASSPGYNCAGRSARATIDKVVDRALAAQTPGPAATGSCGGYWGYTGNGCDSSTTQYTSAGLAAAKAFYSAKGESSDKNRIPGLDAALTLISNAYAANGKAPSGCVWDSCGAGGCAGHGYQQYYGAPGSSQQTGSATFVQLMALGKDVNDPAVQKYLRWLQNAYNYTTNTAPESWLEAYFYFLWSSAKGFEIIEKSGVAPTGTNIGPAAMGTLPALSACGYSRLTNRDPATDTRPPARGPGAAGYYAGTPEGWYYDYAYRLMSWQGANGQFINPNGSWNTAVDHAYALLVLERSIGGACVDTDQDGVCDDLDNCVNKPNPGQEDQDGDGVGDVCDNCPKVANPDQKDSNGNGIGDACEGKCDVDNDGDIDKRDTALISKNRGKTVPPLDQAYDANGDGVITPADVKVCIPKCTLANCATQ